MRKIIYSASFICLAGVLIGLVQACKQDDVTYGTPSVLSFSPDKGAIGTVVTLTGTYFSTAAGNLTTNVVEFNGVKATIVPPLASAKPSPTSLMVIVPSGASTGKVSVSVDGRTGTSEKDFTVLAGKADPYILDFNPKSGNGIDDVEVTITGFNFSETPEDNTVKFNGVATAVPSKASPTSLTVKVPQGSTSGKITVNVSGATGEGTSADFTVPSPTITSYTPSASTIGSTVVITGTNFSATSVNNVVKINGVEATVVAPEKEGSTTSLTILVPDGATTGKISVTVDGLTATSEKVFTVNP